jgi:hypothetical protein
MLQPNEIPPFLLDAGSNVRILVRTVDREYVGFR